MPKGPWTWRSTSLLIGLALAVYGTTFFVLARRGPGAEAVRRAAFDLRRVHAPGDLVLLAPAYATRAREYLGDLEPVAPLRPELEDLQVHANVQVLGLFGAAERLRPDFVAAGLELHSPGEGDVVVDVYRNPRAWSVQRDLRDALNGARVELRQSDRREACDQKKSTTKQGAPGLRWTCPRDAEWQYVAVEWHRMGDAPRRCFWAHPPSDGQLWIHFPDVLLRGELVGHGGHTLQAVGAARAPVELGVAIDDGSGRFERFSFAVADTWRPFRVALGPRARTGTVSFAIWSEDAGANHFCFAADIRAPQKENS